jgi:hypothetical protein
MEVTSSNVLDIMGTTILMQLRGMDTMVVDPTLISTAIVEGGNNDYVVQNGAKLAGINPELLKEAMQGVVAALAVAAQGGGAEGVTPSALGAVVSAGAQADVPTVQQPQTTATGVHRLISCRWIQCQNWMLQILLRRRKRLIRILVFDASNRGTKLILALCQFVTFVSHLIIFLVLVRFFRLLNHLSLCMGMRSNNSCSLSCPKEVHTSQRLTM